MVHRWFANRGVLVAVTALLSMICAVFRTYVLGFFLYIAICYLMFDLLCFLIKLLHKKWYQPMKQFGGNGIWIAGIAVLITVLSMLHVRDIHIVHYTVDLKKEIANQNLRFLFVTDFHLGTTTNENVFQTLEDTAKEKEVDYIIIGGDMIDESTSDELLSIAYQRLSDLAREYPIYYVLGNHEYIGVGDVEGLVEHMELAGVHVLTDEVVLVDDAFYLIGRVDKYNSIVSTERASLADLTQNIDFSYPVILLDHQPVELKLARDLKVDLLLSGHTHAGQFFPISIFAAFFNEQLYGLKQDGDFHSIVSSGAGVWGMAMRNASNSEMVIIDLK